MTSSQPFSIAVVGAGLGGLVLARVLQLRGIAVTVFEREPNSSSRGQGGTLDMHPQTGQYALETAQLTTQFRKIARPEDDVMRIMDKHGTVVFEHHTPPAPEGSSSPDEHSSRRQDRPEIDRGQLRQLLLDSLHPGTVRWEHSLESAQFTDDHTKVSLTFASASASPPTTHTFDVVIGADGTWSRVRPLLSPAQPTYTGVTLIEIELALGDPDGGGSNDNEGAEAAALAELAAFVGRGNLFAASDNRGIIAQRNSGGMVRTYATMRLPLGALDAVATQGEQELRAAILRYFDGWASQLRALIDTPSTSGFVMRPLWVLPCGLEWDVAPGGRTTLLGDAAHLMTPFAGLGANLAMADGADLGLALAEAKTPAELVKRVQEYEAAMRRRSREGWEKSMGNMDAFLSDRAPAASVEKWKEQMPDGGASDANH